MDSLIRQIRKNKTKLERRLREVSFDDVFNAPDTADEETEYDVCPYQSGYLETPDGGRSDFANEYARP